MPTSVTDGPQIFTVRSNGKQLRQITHVDGGAALPDWSPDGRRIAFTLNECAIALMDADGGNLHEIASDRRVPERRELHPGRSATRLHPLRLRPRGRADLEHEDRRLRPAVHHRRRRSRSERLARRPEVSFKGPPDGALFVANIDGSGIVQVSPSISVTYKHDWAPDGRHLVVSDNSNPAPDEAVNIVTVRPEAATGRT